MQNKEWVGIAYLIPATPSRGRVFVWRKLKSIGAQILKPGLAALPNTKENIKSFEALERKIEEFSGESTIIQFNFLNSQQEDSFKLKFKETAENQYRLLLSKCENILSKIENERNIEKKKSLQKTLLKTMKNCQKINNGTVTSQAIQDMENAASEIMQALKQMPAEFKSIFKKD